MKRTSILISITLAAAVGLAWAGDAGIRAISLPTVPTELKAGEGRDKTSGLCAVCHSLDYITMQPPFSRGQWAATVNKMIKVMGAPISEEDANIVVNYLVSQYGTGK